MLLYDQDRFVNIRQEAEAGVSITELCQNHGIAANELESWHRIFVGEISTDERRITTILKTDIFDKTNEHHPLLASAITEVMICLNDLLQKCAAVGARIEFKDEVDVTVGIADVTDLVRIVRNTVCHIASPNHRLVEPDIRFTFNAVYQRKQYYHLGKLVMASDYDDDVCFFFGTLRIYLRRHIIRAFRDAEKNLDKYYSSSWIRSDTN